MMTCEITRTFLNDEQTFIGFIAKVKNIILITLFDD